MLASSTRSASDKLPRLISRRAIYRPRSCLLLGTILSTPTVMSRTRKEGFFKLESHPHRLDSPCSKQDSDRKTKKLLDVTPDPLDCTGLQHLGLEQGAGQGWGGLPRGSLPPHCLPPPPGHHSHTHPPAAGASAFNPFHHSIEQRSPRLPGPNTGKNLALLRVAHVLEASFRLYRR